MGIGVRRVLGYGLTDVKTSDEGEIIDKRFKYSGIMRNGSRVGFSFDGYIEHIKKIYEQHDSDTFERINVHLAMSAAQGDKPWLTSTTYNQVIHYDGEFGLKNVICFIPPSMVNQWTRYDDAVDYYMEYNLKSRNCIDNTTINNNNDWCQILDVPLYPFEGYMHVDTGERTTYDEHIHEIVYSLRAAEENIRVELLEPVPNVSKINNERQLIRNNLDTIKCKEHWMEKYTPIIPGDLHQYLVYTNMFKDEKTIWQLKPMIYTYWDRMEIKVNTTIDITIDTSETPFTGKQTDAIVDKHNRLRTILNDDIKKFAEELLSEDNTDDAFDRGRIIG